MKNKIIGFLRLKTVIRLFLCMVFVCGAYFFHGALPQVTDRTQKILSESTDVLWMQKKAQDIFWFAKNLMV